jgi:WD40 repeat protein
MEVAAGPESFICSGFSADWDWFFAVDSGGLIRLWKTSTGKLLSSIPGPKPPIRASVLSADAGYLAISLERENIIHLYATRLGREILLQGHRDFVSGLAFAPDGKTLASGSMDGTILLWSVADGKQVASLPGHREETTDVAFSPDGRTLASLAHGDSLKLWHLPTLREVVSLEFTEAGNFLQFSPDGHFLVLTTDRDSVRLLEAPGE